MPKTYKNLASQIYYFDNLDAAFHEMSKGMKDKHNVLEYRLNYEEKIINLQNNLIWKSYRPSPYREFTIYEPKMRKISAPTIEDRLVHHALCRVVEPLFDRRFIYSSYACRKGKGMLAATKRVQHYLRQQPLGSTVYYLRMDFHKYFHSINHDVAKRLVRRVIGDKYALWLFDLIIDSYDEGLPIGALTSQLLANVVGDSLDHYLCDELSCKHYARYMDDVIVVSTNYEHLQCILAEAKWYSKEYLQLDLNHNKSHIAIAELKQDDKIIEFGIDFAGYRIYRNYLEPRKRNVKNAKKRHGKLSVLATNEKAEKKLIASANSFVGYMKHCKRTPDAYRALNSARIRDS